MNKDSVIQKMINYIEEEERDLQAAQISNDIRAGKADIVNGILDKLEKEMNDEN